MALCKKLGPTFRKAVRQIENTVLSNAALALSITKLIKSFMDSEAIDLVVLLTKTTADDKLLKRTKDALIVSIDALSLVDNCKHAVTLEEKVKCFTEALAKFSPDVRDGILIKLANLLTAHLSGMKENQSYYDGVTQGVYSTEKLVTK